MQPEEDLGARLAQIDAVYRAGDGKSAAEIDAILGELNSLASKTHSELSGDEQSTVARVDELRRLYTHWYNEAVKADQANLRAGETLTELETRFVSYRQQWVEADADTRLSLQTEIATTLGRVEAKPGSSELAKRMRTFLHNVAHVEGY